MKEIVMWLKSPFTRSTDHQSLLKHHNIDFEGRGGGDSYLKSDLQEGRVTKILNFALKIERGGREGDTCEVLRSCHPPPKFGTCTYAKNQW